MKTNLELTDDAALIELFRNGNEDAFNCLVSRHRAYVREGIRNFLPKDFFLFVDDFLQDTFIKVYNRLKDKENVYDEKGYFKTYAYRIAHNLCTDYLRKEKSRGNPYAGATQDATERILHKADWSSGIKNPEEILIRKEEMRGRESKRKNFHALMKLLPDDQLEVLLFRTYSEHIPFRDIAVIMDRPLNTTLGKHRYALKNIQNLYDLQMSFYRT